MTAAAERLRQHGDGGGSVAAASEARWQRFSEAATEGSAVMASAARDCGGRDEDNGGDSDGGVHSQQSTKRGSGRDDSGGDGDGGRNSNSDGNGDSDSEYKDGDPMLKGFSVGTEDWGAVAATT